MFTTLTIARLADEIVEAYDNALAAVQGNTRWTNAVETGADWVYTQDTVEYDLEAHALRVASPSGRTYTANGVCQCEAYAAGQPCWHRAAGRIVQRAVEAVEAQAEAIRVRALEARAPEARRKTAQEEIDELFN